MDAAPEDMWTPYKQFYNTLQTSLANPNEINVANLECCLKKHKQNFVNILKNPPKNEKSRQQLRNSGTEGIAVGGQTRKINVSKEIIDEAMIISDMFDMDELIALELLWTAQRQALYHPGLPRGLIAILLYYDGRKALTASLRYLTQSTEGVSWTTELPRDLTNMISTFTQNLMEETNLLANIIDILENHLDVIKESEMLTKNRALGGKKHQNQFFSMFHDIRLSLATTLFNWSAQRGLSKDIVVGLINYFAKYKTPEASGLIDDVGLTMLMALLYAIDTSVLQRYDETNVLVPSLPVFSEKDFAQHIIEALNMNTNNITEPRINGSHAENVDSIIKFAFALTLASLRHAPANLQTAMAAYIDSDENIMDEAIASKIFDYVYYNILEKELLYKTEFFYRRIHILFTDFIDFMHSKVNELRGRADETSRTIISYRDEGLDPPNNLDNNFVVLLLCIGKFYKDNPAGLALCEEYWGPMDVGNVNAVKTTTRSVCLFKFIRLAGELLPSSLYIPYLRMLAGLISCERSARNAFKLLKQTNMPGGCAAISWDHFFASIKSYYNNLRQDFIVTSDSFSRNRTFARYINPLEVEGLQAVFALIRAVATYDSVSRLVICQNHAWTPAQILVGLLTCSVPMTLKAEIILTLAALAKSIDSAITIWNCLETAQVIKTIPTSKMYASCSLSEEIDQNESRIEMYALTNSILNLLYTLFTTYMPRNLGSGIRKTGWDPYLTLIIKTIFLKFYNRIYKNPLEKWQIGSNCVRLLHYLLDIYEPNSFDFIENSEKCSEPGYHIMLQLNMKSDMLHLILTLIDDIRVRLDDYSKFRGKEQLEDCALYCLLILECGLSKQNSFYEAHSISNSSILLSGLNRMLLHINPRTNKPDMLLNIIRYVTYNNWLPRHTLAAIQIIKYVFNLPNISTQILGMFGSDAEVQKQEIRLGFVECLEAMVTTSNAISEQTSLAEQIDAYNYVELQNNNLPKTEIRIKLAIVDLLQSAIMQPMPNFIYFLLGFEQYRELSSSSKQVIAIENGFNCMKALVYIIEQHHEETKYSDIYNEHIEEIIAQIWQLFFSLYSNRRTSEAIIRYFRSCCNDFLMRYLGYLPFKHYMETFVLKQMSDLLKCVSIELKLLSQNGQISRLHAISNILVGTSLDNTRQSNLPLEYSNIVLQTTRNYSDTLFAIRNSDPNVGLHLCRLLNFINLAVDEVPLPKFDFFDASLTRQILKDCQNDVKDNYKVINIKKLHRILNDELGTINNSFASGQRHLILKELHNVLLYATNVNAARRHRFAVVRFVMGWTQLTQSLFTFVPDNAMPMAERRQYITDILEKILNKILDPIPSIDISVLAADTVLILLAHLCYCFHKLEENKEMYTEQNDTILSQEVNVDLDQSTHLNTPAAAAAPPPPPPIVTTATTIPTNELYPNIAHLRFILKSIIEWIMISDIRSQTLRLDLYAAFLYMLRIMKRHRKSIITPTNDHSISYVSLLDKSKNNSDLNENKEAESQIAVEVINSFGESLIEKLCVDAVSGHDVCRMLALSCLNLILELNPVSFVLDIITTRGYLANIINEISESDSELCDILREKPDNLKILYTYESKMAFILRMTTSYIGAEMVLTEKFLSILTDMKIFDMQPDLKSNILHCKEAYNNEQIPSVNERYRSILLPALDICDSLITTLGTENYSVSAQIVNFLSAHIETIEVVLRTATPFMDLGFLQELSSITNIIARTASNDINYIPFRYELIENDTAHSNNDFENRTHRIQQLMLTLYSRFIVSPNTIKEMLKSENILYEATEKNKNLHVHYFMEIAANIALYSRNAMTCRTTESRNTKFLLTTMFELPTIDNGQSDPKRLTNFLNIIVNQLKGSVEYFLNEKSYVDNLLQQRSSLPNVSFEPTAKTRFLDLTKRYNDKYRDLTLIIFILEQNLHILWLHLDYYLKHAIIFNLNTKTSINDNNLDNENNLTANYDEILGIKQTLIATFNVTFCNQVISICELNNYGSKTFAEALLRRIKSLIQFVPVN